MDTHDIAAFGSPIQMETSTRCQSGVSSNHSNNSNSNHSKSHGDKHDGATYADEAEMREQGIDVSHAPGVKKVLRWWDLMSLGIGCIIGSGIFVTTGRVFTTVTGPAIILSYLTAACCCCFASLCYSEFSAMAPNSGSAYAFTSQTLGEFPAWLVGWNLVLEYTVSAATVAQGFSSYFQTFVALCGGNIFPRDSEHDVNAAGSGTMWISYPFWLSSSPYLTGSAIDLWAVLLALTVGLIVTAGVTESIRFNHVMVCVKLTVVLFVVVMGAVHSDVKNNFSPFAPFGYGGLQFFGHQVFGTASTSTSNNSSTPIGMLAGASTVFFAYIGFDAVSAQAEEAVDPGRDMPIGIIGSLSVATALYVAVCVVISGMVPYAWYDPVVTAANGGVSGLQMRHISNSAILADVFTYHGQTWAAVIVAVGAMAGLASVTLVTMMAQPRIFLSMARDGLLPHQFFAALGETTRTPWRSCLLLAVVTATLAAALPQSVLLDMTNIGTLFAFTFVCISLPVYRYTHPDRPRPFKAPFSDYRLPLVPVLGAGLSIVLAFSLDSQNWYRLFGWIGVGLVIYFGYGRSNARNKRKLKAELPQHIQQELLHSNYSYNDSSHREDTSSSERHGSDDSNIAAEGNSIYHISNNNSTDNNNSNNNNSNSNSDRDNLPTYEEATSEHIRQQ